MRDGVELTTPGSLRNTRFRIASRRSSKTLVQDSHRLLRGYSDERKVIGCIAWGIPTEREEGNGKVETGVRYCIRITCSGVECPVEVYDTRKGE